MGKNSSTTHGRMQPSLFHAFKYNRLPSSPGEDNKQPLLANDYNGDVEQLKLETEALRKNIQSFEKMTASLEKDMRVRTSITPKKEQSSNIENMVAALVKEVADLKSTVHTLKSTFTQSITLVPDESGSVTNDLKKKVEKLEIRLMTVELDNSTKLKLKSRVYLGLEPEKLETWKDKALAEEKIVELDKPLIDLTPIHETNPTTELDKQLIDLTPIHETKSTNTFESDCLITSMEQEVGSSGHDPTFDLDGCLIVLIFLVSVLIGLNM